MLPLRTSQILICAALVDDMYASYPSIKRLCHWCQRSGVVILFTYSLNGYESLIIYRIFIVICAGVITMRMHYASVVRQCAMAICGE
jgi:hypothetical protein